MDEGCKHGRVWEFCESLLQQLRTRASEESRFCPKCGRPLHETASVSAPGAEGMVLQANDTSVFSENCVYLGLGL